jgi:hypothetical protein
MFRILFVAATVVSAIHVTPAQAQHRRHVASNADVAGGGVRTAPVQLVGDRFFRRSRSSRRSRTPSLFGFSIGIGNYYSDRQSGYHEFDPHAFSGYAYDPYTFGHFEAPDLLKDPYFRERHRYDSHFKSPLIPRKSATHSAPSSTRRSYGYRGAPLKFRGAQATPADRSSFSEQLRSACDQLSRSLAERDDGEVWLEFLAPERIGPWIEDGNTEALQEVLTHYDGVVGNPEYRSISMANGFASTRSLLRQYVN